MQGLQELIAGFRNRPLPASKPRAVRIKKVPGMASVVIGMRRSGKTYLLFREMERLLQNGVSHLDMLYMNFEDDRLFPLEKSILSDTLDTFYRMKPNGRESRSYLFFDEVQEVEEWERFGRRVLDTENVELYLTGSSSRLLSREVASAFRGRGITTELLPLSFSEAVVFSGKEPYEDIPGPGERSLLEGMMEDYLRVGGFPAVQGLEELQRIQVLQDYVEIVLLRDVIERFGMSNPHAIRAFTHALLQSNGSRFSVHKLYGDLKSRGIRIGRDTLYDTLDHLSDSFLLFKVPVFSRSLRVRESNPRKAYAIDPGLVMAMSPSGTSNIGQRLECAVYLELRRRLIPGRSANICYYQTESGYEVDFVIGDPGLGSARQLLQVSAVLNDPETRKREYRALIEGMNELGLSRSTIISLYERDRVKTDSGLIDVVPAWQRMLDLSLESDHDE